MTTKTKADSDHLGIVAASGCIACRNEFGLHSEAECHHIGNGTMGKRSSHREAIALCPMHHRLGCIGVAIHSGRKSFEANFGAERELLAQTLELLK